MNERMNQAAHKEEAGWKWESRNEREIKEMKKFLFRSWDFNLILHYESEYRP